MKATGIIVEYNPLHSGHIYHLQQAKQLTNCDVLVAVMSGNFVQRGQFAIIDKWVRAKAAIESGVDLVLELPFVFATQAASQFGQHSIDILNLAKCDSVVFGSETNNMEELQEIASLSFNINNFKANMKKGYSYPYTYGYMADSYGPNDILAISYLRALKQYPHINAIAIKRESDYNNDELNEKYPSALAIRQALKDGRDVSQFTPLSKNLRNYPSPCWNEYYGYIRNILLTTPIEKLQGIFLMDEGIENLLVKNAYSCFNFEEFMNASISKRYTRSRIQRTLCQLLVNNTKDDMNKLVKYDCIRPLAYSVKGKEYLKELQQQDVKIANHFTANLKQYRDIEYKAAVAYSMNMNDDMKEYICRSEISGLNYKKD